MAFDPNAPDFKRDPYATYKNMRNQTPIFYDDASSLWFISRYEDVSALLRDRRLGRVLSNTSRAGLN